MSIWDGFHPATPLRDADGKYTRWDTPCEPMTHAEMLEIVANMKRSAGPPARAIPVRRSLYDAHRRRWLAHLLSSGLGYRSTLPPLGCVA